MENTEIKSVQDWANEELAADSAAAAPKGISEDAIAEKVKAGLTRNQAIEVINNQRDWDRQQAAAAKQEKKTSPAD